MNEAGGVLPDIFLEKKAWVVLAALVAFPFSYHCLLVMLTSTSQWLGIARRSPEISAVVENLDEQAFVNNENHLKCVSAFTFQTFKNRICLSSEDLLHKPWCITAVRLVSSSWAWANNTLLLYRKIKIEHVNCMIPCSSYKILFLDRWRFAVRKLKSHQPCMHSSSRLAGKYLKKIEAVPLKGTTLYLEADLDSSRTGWRWSSLEQS